MKMFVSRLLRPLVFSAFLTAPATLSAQEAWLLEMPNKYADFLIKQALASEYDTVTEVIDRLPGLIEKGEVKEIELIKWKSDTGGKKNKVRKVEKDKKTLNYGAYYRSAGGDGFTKRKFTIASDPSARSFTIDSNGTLGREWTPTFAHRAEKMTIILLERHAESKSSTVSIDHFRKLSFDTTTTESLTWFSPESLDGRDLMYRNGRPMPTNPKISYGYNMFCDIEPEGNSLIRMEAHSFIPGDKEMIALHHNEARFEGVSQTTGPMKKENIKIADKSYSGATEQGKWTLEIVSK